MTLIQVRCTYSIKTYGEGAIKLICFSIANITFLHHRPTNQLDMYDFSAADMCEYWDQLSKQGLQWAWEMQYCFKNQSKHDFSSNEL